MSISRPRKNSAASRSTFATKARRPVRLALEILEARELLSIAPVWNAIGPAPILGGQTAGSLAVSGRVVGIATDPQDAKTIFIAAAGGGVWKTTDGGTTWTPLTDRVSAPDGTPVPQFMGAVAETRGSGGTEIVYAGTGEANNSADTFYGTGILVSTDGGATWTLQNDGGKFTGATVAKIVIDPADTTGKTLYAAIDSNGANSPQVVATGIYKSSDGGATWTNTTAAAPNGLSTTDTWSDVVLDPVNHHLFAALGTSTGSANNGVCTSTNGGGTWVPVSALPSGANDGRIALALHDDGTTNELFVAISNPSTNALAKMLRSTDAEATFTDITSKLTIVSNYLGTQGNYDTTLAIDPANANYIYAGGAMANQGPTFGGSPLESFDGGNTWHDLATDSAGNGPHSDDHAVAFDASGNLIDGNDGGVFKLSNPTDPIRQRWSSLNTNLQITEFTSVTVNPQAPNIVFGGSQDNATEKYTGQGGWQRIEFGDGGITAVDPANPNNVYQERFSNVTSAGTTIQLQLSTKAGAPFTFNSVTQSVNAPGEVFVKAVNFYAPYVLDGNGAIYFGTDYLNLSTNQGATWTQLGTPGTNTASSVFNPSGAALDALALAPSNNNVLYVAAGGKLFVTQNAQAGAANVTWKEIDLPGGVNAGSTPESLTVDPTNPGTAYAVINSFKGGSSNHVFMTTDFGATWKDVARGSNLPAVPVDAIALSADGKQLFLGTDVGVFASSDGGATWPALGVGLPNVQVGSLEFVPSQNLLVAGTYGRGAWELSLAVAVSVQPQNVTAVNDGLAVAETAVFAAAAASMQGKALTSKWQVSTDGGLTWRDDTTATVTTFIDATGHTSTRLRFVVGAGDNGSQYRAAFTDDGGAHYSYSNAALLQLASSVTYWHGGGHDQYYDVTNGDPNAWSNPANWSNGLPSPSNYALLANTVPAFTETDHNGNNPQTFKAPFNEGPNVDQGMKIGGLFLNFNGGGLSLAATLELTGDSEWDGGSIAPGQGTLINDAGAVLTMVNQGQDPLGGGGQVLNFGTMVQTTAQTLTFAGNSTTLTNEPGAIFDMDADSSVTNNGGVGAGFGAFRNLGLLEKTAGTLTGSPLNLNTGSAFFQVYFMNSGTIEVGQGQLTVSLPLGAPSGDPAEFIGGTYNADAGAVFSFGSYYTTATGTLSGGGAGQVEFQNTLQTSTPSTLNFAPNLFQWNGGSLVAATSGTSASWTNAGSLTFLHGALTGLFLNRGTLTQATDSQGNAGVLGIVGGALLDNEAGAVFDLHGDGSITGVSAAGTGSFLNQGLFLKSAGANTGTIGVPFSDVSGPNGQGTIHVQTGTLKITGAGKVTDASGNVEPANYLGSNFVVDAGTVLDLTGGQTLSATGTLTGSGAGAVLLSQGSLQAVGSGATLNFPGTLFQWTGGTLDGSSAAWTNAPTGLITLAGNAALAGILHNQGTITQTADSQGNATNLGVPGGALLDNQAGATYDLHGDGSFSGISAAGTGNLVNHGLFVKSAGTNTGLLGIPIGDIGGMNGQGTIRVQKGTLKLSAGGKVTDASGNVEPANYLGSNFIADPGAVLDLTGGQTLTVAGTLTGSGAGQVLFSQGSLQAVGSGATLNFPGTLFQWTGGLLDGNSAAWTNASTGTISLAGSGAITGVLHNQGTFNQTGSLALPAGACSITRPAPPIP